MKGFWAKTALFLAVAGFVGYIGYQAYAAANPKLETEQALPYTFLDKISAEAYIVRNEEVITTDAGGVRSFAVESGTRVQKGGVIANVFTSEEQAGIQQQINDLEAAILSLQSLNSEGSVAAGDIDGVKTLLGSEIEQLHVFLEQGNYRRASEQKAKLLELMNKKQLIVGDVSDFSGTIQALTAEKDSLKNQMIAQPQAITTDKAGYFLSHVDGYEGRLSAADAEKLTVSRWNELMEAAPGEIPAGAVGKIVQDFEWRIVLKLTRSQAEGLSAALPKDGTVRIDIPTAGSAQIPAKVLNVNYEGDEAVAVLSCNYMSEELSEIRKETVGITVGTYTGARINSEAVRFVDNVEGVYTVVGLRLVYKPVNVLYTGRDFVICEFKSQPEGSDLRMYDEIVLKGKNLYDGKVIR